MSEELKTELNRRNFLAAAAALTGACAMGCPFAQAKDEDDDDDDEPVPTVKMGPVDIGPVSDFTKDGPTDKWVKDRHMIVVRDKDKLFALTAICTHKQALLKTDALLIVCPRHKSRFNEQGQPIPKANGKVGLAKKPLTHFAISINDQKHVIVDTSKTVAADAPDGMVELRK